jgi:hypothetical protein
VIADDVIVRIKHRNQTEATLQFGVSPRMSDYYWMLLYTSGRNNPDCITAIVDGRKNQARISSWNHQGCPMTSDECLQALKDGLKQTLVQELGHLMRKLVKSRLYLRDLIYDSKFSVPNQELPTYFARADRDCLIHMLKAIGLEPTTAPKELQRLLIPAML